MAKLQLNLSTSRNICHHFNLTLLTMKILSHGGLHWKWQEFGKLLINFFKENQKIYKVIGNM